MKCHREEGLDLERRWPWLFPSSLGSCLADDMVPAPWLYLYLTFIKCFIIPKRCWASCTWYTASGKRREQRGNLTSLSFVVGSPLFMGDVLGMPEQAVRVAQQE